MNTPLHRFGAVALTLLLASTLSATTATSLSSFGGIEEPQVIYYPGTNTFQSDSFVNITDLGGGVFQMKLRYNTSGTMWWDGDRTTSNTDRQRAEIKTLGAHQLIHQTFDYTTTWKMSSGFKGSGAFCHITQLKPVDGVEGSSGAPLITTSLFSGSSTAAVRYASASFSPANTFSPKVVRNLTYTPGSFLSEKIRVTTTADGENTGEVLVSINGDAFQGVTNVEVCRPSSTEYYPKWGFYRGVSTTSGFGPADYIQHSNVSAGEVTSTPTAATPAFSPGSGAYTGAQSVTISTTTAGATIRYTTDGSTPSETNGAVYSSPVTVGSSLTLQAIAYESGYNDSTVGSAAYTISLPTAATPAFSPGSGTYSSAQSVTITTATPGATIRYTTDGSAPSETNGTIYSGPVTVGSSLTMQAIAYASGYSDSAVGSAAYTISISTGGPITLEAEDLGYTTSGQTLTTGTDASASGGVVTYFNATGTGQYVEFTTPSLSSSTYQLQYAYKHNSSRGQHSVVVDGVQLGGTIDEYASTSGYTTVTIGTVTLGAGTHTIRLTITGKNASSSGYVIAPDAFILTPETTPPPTVTMEAENLSTTTSGPTVTTQSDANASGGVVTYFNATGTGQWVQYTTPSLPAGTYQVQYAYKHNGSRGQHNLTVDGTQVGGTVDEYSSTSGYSTATLGNVTFGSAGTHTIRLTITGKNSSSSSYVIAPDSLTFVGQ